MLFCPECGMRFVKFFEKNGKKFAVCKKNHVVEIKKGPPLIVRKKTERDIVIVEGKNEGDDNSTPLTIVSCPYCGSKNCTFFRTYTIHADEGDVSFLKCLDCGKNFRCGGD